MKIATPEQKRIFRRRRMMTTLGIIGIAIFGFVLGIGLLVTYAHYKHDMPFAVGFGILLVTGLSCFLFRLGIFRCPICGRPISNRYAAGKIGDRNTFGSRCEKCDVDFAA